MSDQYPSRWADFIGQDLVTEQLRIAAKSAFERGVPFGHVLFSSPIAGIGKSALAHLLARELHAAMHMVSGKVDEQAARMAFARMEDGDVLVIDEIHRVFTGGKRAGEWLLHALQDGAIIGPAGVEQLPEVTIVGTTTDLARIPEPVVSRFPHRPVLTPYSHDEAKQIAAIMAPGIWGDVELPLPNNDDLNRIVIAADRNPRNIRQILKNLLDVAWVEFEQTYDGDNYDLSKPLRWLGLSHDGLDMSALSYLEVLMDKFGGVAGEKVIADSLRETAGVRHIERSLLDRDLIRLTPKGRALTQAGIRRAQQYATTKEG